MQQKYLMRSIWEILETYYWLGKVNDINFDIMCINKIFNAEIEK